MTDGEKTEGLKWLDEQRVEAMAIVEAEAEFTRLVWEERRLAVRLQAQRYNELFSTTTRFDETGRLLAARAWVDEQPEAIAAGEAALAARLRWRTLEATRGLPA